MQKYCEEVVFGEIRKSLEFRKHCGVAREWHCQSYLPSYLSSLLTQLRVIMLLILLMQTHRPCDMKRKERNSVLMTGPWERQAMKAPRNNSTLRSQYLTAGIVIFILSIFFITSNMT